MRRDLPILVTAGAALVMILAFFVPHPLIGIPADFLQHCAVLLVAIGAVLGGANLVRVHLPAIARRETGWPYKAVLVVALLATVMIGAVDGARGGGPLAAGTVSRWIYDRLYAPLGATIFALLAFFIASAALRAFRIRSLEATLLAIAALVVVLGRVPLGDALTAWLPESLRLGALQQWVMDVPQTAARRAILIGAALGVLATGLRVALAIERPDGDGEE